MTQPEDDLTRRIIEALDRDADQLDPVARARLGAVRERALERFPVAGSPAFGLAWAGGAFSKVSGLSTRTRSVVLLAILLVVISAFAIWTRLGQKSDVAEIDAELLADELPINAYLDKGFDSWLKRGLR